MFILLQDHERQEIRELTALGAGIMALWLALEGMPEAECEAAVKELAAWGLGCGAN